MLFGIHLSTTTSCPSIFVSSADCTDHNDMLYSHCTTQPTKNTHWLKISGLFIDSYFCSCQENLTYHFLIPPTVIRVEGTKFNKSLELPSLKLLPSQLKSLLPLELQLSLWPLELFPLKIEASTIVSAAIRMFVIVLCNCHLQLS